MQLFDTHAHLTSDVYRDEVPAVLERAQAAGVTRWLTVGANAADSAAAVALAETHAHLYATVGIHPHDAAAVGPDDLDRLRDLARHNRVVAVGEIGLDYHYDFSPRSVQQDILRRQLEWALEDALPVIVHCREAFADCLAILREIGAADHPLVFHCFGHGPAEARTVVEHGWYVSFAGTVTFKKATDIQQAAQVVPLERLLIETDCPYLSPAPRRSVRPNEPALLVHTAAQVARLRGIETEQLAQVTLENGRSCFRID